MRMSFLFFDYLYWIVREAQKHGIKRLYFFTREGEFFKKLYDRFLEKGNARREMPTAQVLEVSRMSTFFPSVREITIPEMMRLWRQYPEQSMRMFCQSLHIEPEHIQSCLERYELAPDLVIRQPWKDERIRRMFADAAFIRTMEREREQQRRKIVRYLKQHGWSKTESETIGIVDIGWKGTIQDNLCYLYPNYKIVGFYLGLQPFLSEQPLNAEKYGYLDGYSLRHVVLLTVRPLEMLCSSPNGSVTTYVWNGQAMEAVRKKDRKETAVFYNYSMPMQKIIQKQMDVMIETWIGKKTAFHLNGYEKRRLKQKIGKARYQAYRFIAYPDRKSVRAYFLLCHNEEFGKGTYIQAPCRFRPGLLLKAAITANGRRSLKQYLKEVSWPQGYFTKYGLYPLLMPYNYLLLQYLKKKNHEKNEK